MSADELWIVARAAGVASLVALAFSLLSGMALRSGILGRLAHNRGVSELHTFTTALWLPLGIVHMGALLFDPYAQVRLIDLVFPFQVPYARIAVGLGTVSVLLIAVVMVTTWMRPSLPHELWLALHQLSYVAFLAAFAHSVLSGTDLAFPALNALVWVTGALLVLGWLRRLGGRGSRSSLQPG